MDSSNAGYKIPKYADFLIAFSTYDGKSTYKFCLVDVLNMVIVYLQGSFHLDTLKMVRGSFRVYALN